MSTARYGAGRRSPHVALVAVLLAAPAAACGSGASANTLRISGSTTVSPVAADAAEVLRGREGLRITVDSQGGSSGGLAQLGQGQVEVAMSSKPVTEEDRGRFPRADFRPVSIGEDALGIVVRAEVYEGGVRNLTRSQLRDLFEGRIANWRELGGPDLDVFVYDKEPGRGTREVLDAFLYGEGAEALPPPASDRFAIVGGNEEGRAKASSTPGAVTPLSVAFVADSSDLLAVAVDGVEPTADNVRSGAYPLSRPLFLVTDGEPSGAARLFIDYVLSEAGQRIVREHGFLPAHLST